VRGGAGAAVVVGCDALGPIGGLGRGESGRVQGGRVGVARVWAGWRGCGVRVVQSPLLW